MIRRSLSIVIALVAATACTNVGTPGPCLMQTGCGAAPKVTVFAAASLQKPFETIGHQAPVRATFNFAGSQTLTAQLTEGAQADVFASADAAHMKVVQEAGLIEGSPQIFAHNRLEIAVAKGNPKHIESLADLARTDIVLVLADPSVPAGKYAQQALTKAGVKVKPASLELEVTAVLNKVALGEADAGIVYVSDVVSSGKVDGIPIPDSQNVIADYPIAILAGAPDKSAARTFVDYILSPAGQAALEQAGFQTA